MDVSWIYNDEYLHEISPSRVTVSEETEDSEDFVCVGGGEDGGEARSEGMSPHLPEEGVQRAVVSLYAAVWRARRAHVGEHLPVLQRNIIVVMGVSRNN